MLKNLFVFAAVIAISYGIFLFFKASNDEQASLVETLNEPSLPNPPAADLSITNQPRLDPAPKNSAKVSVKSNKSPSQSPTQRAFFYGDLTPAEIHSKFEAHAQLIKNARTQGEIDRVFAEALDLSPTRDDIRNDKSDHHETPSYIMHYGQILGAIEERSDQEATVSDSPFTQGALDYYKTCGRDTRLVSSVRMLCIANYTRRMQKLGGSVSENDFDPELTRKSKLLILP